MVSDAWSFSGVDLPHNLWSLVFSRGTHGLRSLDRKVVPLHWTGYAAGGTPLTVTQRDCFATAHVKRTREGSNLTHICLSMGCGIPRSGPSPRLGVPPCFLMEQFPHPSRQGGGGRCAPTKN